jgi:hypothetical protein
VFGEWNDNVFSDDEFPKFSNYFLAQARFVVERNDRGSLT